MNETTKKAECDRCGAENPTGRRGVLCVGCGCILPDRLLTQPAPTVRYGTRAACKLAR